MTSVNEAMWDRVLRALAGAVLLYLGWAGYFAGWVTGGAIGIGVLLVVTALVGWCPLYSLLGVSTHRGSAAGLRH